MGKVLSEAAVEQYRRDGYYYPIVLVPPEEAARYRERLESVERDLGGPLRGVRSGVSIASSPTCFSRG
jgi:hypothetical protein